MKPKPRHFGISGLAGLVLAGCCGPGPNDWDKRDMAYYQPRSKQTTAFQQYILTKYSDSIVGLRALQKAILINFPNGDYRGLTEARLLSQLKWKSVIQAPAAGTLLSAYDSQTGIYPLSSNSCDYNLYQVTVSNVPDAALPLFANSAYGRRFVALYIDGQLQPKPRLPKKKENPAKGCAAKLTPKGHTLNWIFK